MSKWTRANPLMSVPGQGVPPGHYANGYTNGGDRVGFKKGGSVKKNWMQDVNKSIKKRGTKGKYNIGAANKIKNKASAARIKNMSFNIKQTAKKLGDTMDKLGKK